MKRLFKSISAVILYAALSFSTQIAFANPDKIAAALADAADEGVTEAARQIVKVRIEEDLPGLFSEIFSKGKFVGGAYAGKSLSEIVFDDVTLPAHLFNASDIFQLSSVKLNTSSGDFIYWGGASELCLTASLAFVKQENYDYSGIFALKMDHVVSAKAIFRVKANGLSNVFSQVFDKGKVQVIEALIPVTPLPHVEAIIRERDALRGLITSMRASRDQKDLE